ncbi:motility associated factor glycosyltransferase family protein [Campylobacter lari]|nr:motility associated factor glycosyltransferase family protein [Campylobacter lari]EGQ5681888.1 motility associated factor glycosyltransferase family protein [Campylobacter lari]
MFLQKNLQALEFTNKPLQEKISSLKKEDFIDIFPSQKPFVPSKDDLIKPNIFFCGIGDGLFLKKLINKHIFIFDKVEFFANVLNKMDLSQELASGKIYLCDIEEKRLEEQLCILFSQNECFEYLGLFKLLSYSEYYKQSPLFDFTYKICIDVIARISNNMDKTFFKSFRMQKQFLLNLPITLKNPPFVRFVYENKAKNKSVIVVCAGPSLNKQLELLKAYQDDYVIFALDAIYKILLKNEIYPDFVFSLDESDKCFHFYEGLSCGKNNTIFILGTSLHKKLINSINKEKNKIFILSNLDYKKQFSLNDFGYLNFGTNVAHFAYNFAISLGFLNVIMIGQDLAFGDDGNSHADMSVFTFRDEKKAQHNIKKLLVLAYGKKDFIQTNIGWNEFRKRLEALFVANPQINFYNATEGGAFIDYTIEVSFKEILEKLKTEKKPYILPKPLSINRQKKLLKKVLDQIQKEYEEILFLYEKVQNSMQNLKEENSIQIEENILYFNELVNNSYILKSTIYKPLFYYKGFFNVKFYQDPQNTNLYFEDFLKIFSEICSMSLENLDLAIKEYENILKL